MSNLSSLLDRYKALVIFDTETSGLDPEKDQIIELAAMRVERTAAGGLRIAGKMDTFIKLLEGELLPENIVALTGITDELLQREGVRPDKAASQIVKLMSPGPALMIAHNAQFDACFLRELLRGVKVGRPDWLDSLTVYKDRRPCPHKLANAILAYDLGDKVQNSHRAIDDVLALFEVLKAMDEERDDLATYVNLFGYNQKYGVSGRRITGVRYEPQGFIKVMSRPEQTFPPGWPASRWSHEQEPADHHQQRRAAGPRRGRARPLDPRPEMEKRRDIRPAQAGHIPRALAGRRPLRQRLPRRADRRHHQRGRVCQRHQQHQRGRHGHRRHAPDLTPKGGKTPMDATKERAARRNRATPARTSDSQPAHGSRAESIAHRRRPAKYQSRRAAAVVVVILLICTMMASTAVLLPCGTAKRPVDTGPGPIANAPPVAVSEPPAADTSPQQPDPPPARYELTAEERDTVERVVMAEAGGECYEGQVLVAQCILNAAEKLGQQPSEAVVTLRYAKGRPDPTQSVRDAVAAVFDRGETVTDEPILYFYAPVRTTSEWHESQIFVIEVGGHRFFAERSTQ